jgi:hypothetical protein
MRPITPALALLLFIVPGIPAQTLVPSVTTRVDSARGEVVITAGPFRVEPMDHDMADMEMGSYQDTVYTFAWPEDGWMHGYRIELRDAQGRPLPRNMIHHIGLNNFARRQPQYPAVERLLASGKETSDVSLLPSLGVPLAKGDTLGLFAMLMSTDGRGADSAYVVISMPWTVRGRGHPTDVLPLLIDVHADVGGFSRYDLPAGRSERSEEFVLSVSGGLIGVGGHLHDYATSVRLEDVKSGKVLVRLKARTAANGELLSVDRFVFGFHEDMLRLEAGRRYRIVAAYNNTSGKMIPDGAMGMIAGAFVPDDIRAWPPVDWQDPMTQRDLASMPRPGPVAPPAASASAAASQTPHP